MQRSAAVGQSLHCTDTGSPQRRRVTSISYRTTIRLLSTGNSLESDLVSDETSQGEKTKLEEPHGGTDQSSLAITTVLVGVADSIRNSGQAPASAHDAAGDGVAEAGNEKGGDDRGLVLEVVSVGALGAVPQVECVLLLGRVGGHHGAVSIGRGIADTCGLAKETAAEAVPDTQEEG